MLVQRFGGLSKCLKEDLCPLGELENLLVDRIISAVWRLRRVLRIEVELFVSTREYHIETTSFDLLDTKTEIVQRNDGDIYIYLPTLTPSQNSPVMKPVSSGASTELSKNFSVSRLGGREKMYHPPVP